MYPVGKWDTRDFMGGKGVPAKIIVGRKCRANFTQLLISKSRFRNWNSVQYNTLLLWKVKCAVGIKWKIFVIQLYEIFCFNILINYCKKQYYFTQILHFWKMYSTPSSKIVYVNCFLNKNASLSAAAQHATTTK